MNKSNFAVKLIVKTQLIAHKMIKNKLTKIKDYQDNAKFNLSKHLI